MTYYTTRSLLRALITEYYYYMYTLFSRAGAPIALSLVANSARQSSARAAAGLRINASIIVAYSIV